jgi:phage tail sheath gpL-like
VRIENLITTYQKNSYGDADDSYLEVETLFSLMFVTRYLRTAVTSKFGRMKLAADGTRFAPGAAIVTPNIIKADQIAEYQTLVWNGYAQDAEAFAKTSSSSRTPKSEPRRCAVAGNPHEPVAHFRAAQSVPHAG